MKLPLQGETKTRAHHDPARVDTMTTGELASRTRLSPITRRHIAPPPLEAPQRHRSSVPHLATVNPSPGTSRRLLAARRGGTRHRSRRGCRRATTAARTGLRQRRPGRRSRATSRTRASSTRQRHRLRLQLPRTSPSLACQTINIQTCHHDLRACTGPVRPTPFRTGTNGVPRSRFPAEPGNTWAPRSRSTAAVFLSCTTRPPTSRAAGLRRPVIGVATSTRPGGPFVDTLDHAHRLRSHVWGAISTPTSSARPIGTVTTSTLIWKNDSNHNGTPGDIWSQPLTPT